MTLTAPSAPAQQAAQSGWLPDLERVWEQLSRTGSYRTVWHPHFPVRLPRFRRELRARAKAAGLRIQTEVRRTEYRPLLVATLPDVVREQRGDQP